MLDVVQRFRMRVLEGLRFDATERMSGIGSVRWGSAGWVSPTPCRPLGTCLCNARPGNGCETAARLPGGFDQGLNLRCAVPERDRAINQAGIIRRQMTSIRPSLTIPGCAKAWSRRQNPGDGSGRRPPVGPQRRQANRRWPYRGRCVKGRTIDAVWGDGTFTPSSLWQ